MIHTILKMGDPRLLRVAPPVERFDTPELHALIAVSYTHLTLPTSDLV